jgi:hypothetical protein
VKTPTTITAMLCVLGLAVSACEKKPETAEGTAPALTAAQPTVSAASAAKGEPPAAEDFEEEAERTITSENVESELAKLEKEIR